MAENSALETQAKVPSKATPEPVWLRDLSEGTKPRVFVSERNEGLFAAQPPAGYIDAVHRQGQDQGRAPLVPLGTKLLPKALVANATVPEPSPVEQTTITAEAIPEQPAATQQVAQAQSARGTYLQLASLKGEDEASAAGRQLKASFADLLSAYEVTLQPVAINGKGTFQRVRFGPFASRQEAKATCTALKSRGQDCISVTSDLAAARTNGSERPVSNVHQEPIESQNSEEEPSIAPQVRVASGPYLQLIAIRDEEKALAVGSSLKSKFDDLLGAYEIDLQPIETSTRGLVQRVRFGPFASLDTARNTCSALKARDQDCLVVAP